jgi:hypothetical protein
LPIVADRGRSSAHVGRPLMVAGFIQDVRGHGALTAA